MPLTRKLLEGMGLEDKQVETIIEAHVDVVNALKEERDAADERAAKVPQLQRQLEEALEASGGEDEWKAKYESEHKALEDYKAEVEAEKREADKASKYREQVLAKAGIGAEYIDDVMGVTKLDDVKVGEDGAIEGAEELVSKAKEKWASFVVKTKTEGSDPATPPSNKGGENEADPHVKERLEKRYERLYGKTDEAKE